MSIVSYGACGMILGNQYEDMEHMLCEEDTIV